MSDKRVSDMTDAEVRELAGAGDPLSAALDEIREYVSAQESLVARAASAAVGVAEFNAGQDRLAQCVPRLLAAVDAVLKLHCEWRIYEECDHPRILDSDYGCPDCYCYSICRSCCAGDGSGQTEQCASDHDVMHCWPCPTYLAFSRALLGEERPDA